MNQKLTIGMPVYNGEKFIRNALDSLLSQTFRDFELIISDNASTDSTSIICQEYAKQDKRIRYIRQDKNMGSIWNLYFVLQQATSEYFMWAAADDYWLDTFVEKNIRILESDRTVIGSISDIELYREFTEDGKPNIENPANRNKRKFQYVDSAFGTLDQRIKKYLKFFQASIIYGIYRTEVLRESSISDNFWANDFAIVINTLKHGNLHTVDEVLMHRYVQDRPSKSLIQYQLKAKIPIIKIIFLEMPFTIWFLKNFGWKMFAKNLHVFIRLNLRGEYIIASEIIRMIKRLIYGQSKYW